MTSKKTKITQQECELFRQAMKDVTPLAESNKVDTVLSSAGNIKKTAPSKATAVRPNQAPAPLDLYHMLGPNDIIKFARPGLDHNTFKHLRQASYPIQARLDLHGMSRTAALSCLNRFILQHHKKHHLLIIHGKGKNEAGGSVLKTLVNHYLSQHPNILAFHSALPVDGGTGAVYVLLKGRRR